MYMSMWGKRLPGPVATCKGTLQYDCYGGSGEGGQYGWDEGNSIIFGGNLVKCCGIVFRKKVFNAQSVFFC